MRSKQARSIWLGIAILGVLTFTATAPLWGQGSKPAQGIPVPDDWSHRHLIFSKPASAQQASALQKEPRYLQQKYRRELPIVAPQVSSAAEVSHVSKTKQRHPKGLWAESLGTGGSVGANNYPAKFSLLTNSANCGDATNPDYVVYNTGLAGSVTQASVVAYDNLYSGCTGTVPSTYWAYNTSGTVLTSAVLSEDGTQIAFVQTSSGQAGLVVLKWAASTTESVSNPGTPTNSASYPVCTAPCMKQIFLRDGLGVVVDDTTSSVFYDYNTDVAWVGDARGWLHKFTPVFKGAPAEVRTAPWPIQVNPGNPNALSSPVLQLFAGTVFVGDFGGYLYSVASDGTVTKSAQLDHGAGISDGPMVDVTSGLVYVFSSSDGSSNCTGGAACSAVDVLSAGFTGGDSGTEAVVGTSVLLGNTPNPMYIGAFDSTYQNSTNATGNLYVCGNNGLNPTLYQVPMAAGVPGTPAALSQLTQPAQTPACSSVTDFFNPNGANGATEYIYASVQNKGVGTACGGGTGCLMNLVSLPWNASTAYSVGQEILDSNLHVEVVITGGTSGLTTPIWSTVLGSTLTDGSVTWLDQGRISAATRTRWKPGIVYGAASAILDSNGNMEIDTTPGTSGGTEPTWNTTPGGTTSDNGIVWTNAGASPTSALQTAGGASGVIIDNIVGAGTLTGASQVYFSTLADQTCFTSTGTGGCAMQASQSALQ